MNIRTALLAATLFASMVPAAQADEEAEAFVQAFCGLRTLEGGMGLMHLASPDLAAAIRTALAENAKLQAATPDEKPPLGDGVPWQSFQDLSDTCVPGEITSGENATIAEVKYGFASNPGADWSDRLVLAKNEGGSYVVDDIRYGTEGDNSLRKALAEAFGN